MFGRRVMRGMLAAVLAVGFVPHAAFAADATAAGPTQGADPLADVPTNGVIVTLEDELPGFSLLSSDPQAARRVTEAQLDALGMDVTDTLQNAEGDTLLVAQPQDGRPDYEALQAAEALPGVASAQPNFVYHLLDTSEADAALAASSPLSTLATTNDPDLSKQHWVHAAHLDDAWGMAQANHNSTVVVIDSAVYHAHEDLAANLLYNYAWDATRSPGGAMNWGAANVNTNSGHGTHVAGLVAASTNNGVGVAGASYNANILPICVIDSTGFGDTASLLRAYRHVLDLAANQPSLNIRVVNMSLGYYPATSANGQVKPESTDLALFTYIQQARSLGVVTVCAGGNGEGPSKQSYIFPADYKYCVSVTALTESGVDWTDGDYNAQKDISAPGVNVYSTTADGRYGVKTGTSMAAPIVSGVLALMAADVPNATAQELVDAIEATADPIVHGSYSSMTGSKGGINAARALAYLRSMHGEDPGYDDPGDPDVVPVPVDPEPEPDPDPEPDPGPDPEPDPEPDPDPADPADPKPTGPVDRTPTSAEAAAALFDDVFATDWFVVEPTTYLSYVLDRDMMRGVGNRKFNPMGCLTHAHVATILYRYANPNWAAEDVSQAKNATRYVDNLDGQYYTAAINWAVENQIMPARAEYSYARVGVNDPVTRQDLATMLYKFCVRYYGSKDLPEGTPLLFADAPDADQVVWSAKYMNWCYANGIITGGAGGKLDPEGYTKRSHMTKIIKQTLAALPYGEYTNELAPKF